MLGTLHSKVQQNPLQSPSRLIGLHLLHTPCDKIHPTDSKFSFVSTFGCKRSIVVPAENFPDYTQKETSNRLSPLNSSQASSACFLSLLASSSSILLARALRFLLRPCLTLSVRMWNGPMPMLGGSDCSSIFCWARWYSTSSLIFWAGSFLDSYSLNNRLLIFSIRKKPKKKLWQKTKLLEFLNSKIWLLFQF